MSEDGQMIRLDDRIDDLQPVVLDHRDLLGLHHLHRVEANLLRRGHNLLGRVIA